MKTLLFLTLVSALCFLSGCTHTDNGQSHVPWSGPQEWEYNRLGGAR